MNLTYRGIQYAYTAPSVAVVQDDQTDTAAIGRYRGASARVRKAQKALSQQPGLDLKYRGVAYNTNPVTNPVASKPAIAPVAVVATVVPAAPVPEDRTRVLVINHHRAIRQRHRVALLRFASQLGLQGTSASTNWNSLQATAEPISLTTSDRSYDRSHVAFS